MEGLVTTQTSLGKEIEKTLNVYYNDKPEKKNLSYLLEKLEILDNLWSNFEKGDAEIRKLDPGSTDHAYFTSDYFNKVKNAYINTRVEFEKLIQHIDVSKGAIPKNTQKGDLLINPIVNPPTLTNGSQFNIFTSDDDKLTKLIRRQKMAISAIEHVLAGIEYNNQTKQYYELKSSTIKHYWNQIEENNNSIREMVEDDSAIEYKFINYFELEDKIHITLIKLNEALEKNQGITQTTGGIASTTLSHMKLPKIVLPRFDGNYLRWQQFYDLFSQMVHNQPMSNVQKMWYLKMNLAGEAEKLIGHLAPTDDNYVTAWNMLQGRYANKRLLVTALLDRLMAQPSIHNESATTIKALHDTTKECLLSLQNLGLSVKVYWDPIIVHIIMKKLDKTTHAL